MKRLAMYCLFRSEMSERTGLSNVLVLILGIDLGLISLASLTPEARKTLSTEPISSEDPSARKAMLFSVNESFIVLPYSVV